jgi:tetratricopeptide (TPR) repeat protein
VVYLGALELAQGKWAAAFPLLEEGIVLADRSQDHGALEAAHVALAEHDLLEGHPEAARMHLDPLLERSDQENASTPELLPLMAKTSLELGNQALAEALTEQTIARARGEGDRFALVPALFVQAILAARQEHWPEAVAALEEAQALARAIPYPYAEAKALYTYGQLYAAKGEPAQARETYEQALAILDRLGEGLYRPHVERALAEVAKG